MGVLALSIFGITVHKKTKSQGEDTEVDEGEKPHVAAVESLVKRRIKMKSRVLHF